MNYQPSTYVFAAVASLYLLIYRCGQPFLAGWKAYRKHQRQKLLRESARRPPAPQGSGGPTMWAKCPSVTPAKEAVEHIRELYGIPGIEAEKLLEGDPRN